MTQEDKTTVISHKSQSDNKNTETANSPKGVVKNYRIQGVLLNNKKTIYYALQDVFGIGKTRAKLILEKSGIPQTKKTNDLSEEEFSKIQSSIESLAIKLEGDLRQEIFENINTYKLIKCYRGIRHKAGLPVRGQNTRRNARTRKGRVKLAVGGLNKVIAKK